MPNRSGNTGWRPTIFTTLQNSLHNYKKDWCEVTYERADGVTFTVQGKEGDNLLDIAINNDIDLEGFGACEGTLACSTCHLTFKQEDFDNIEDPCTDEELDMLDLAYGLSDTELCVSLSGCGFLGVYLIGALHCLTHRCPRVVRTAHFSGSSAGAIMAAAVVCGLPLNTVRAGFLRTAARARQQTMSTFSPGFRMDEQLTDGLESLPPDAHVKASGRLHVSVTRLRDGAHVVFSHWNTRQELIHTLRCSCFILGFSGGWPPTIEGEVYIDGGYRNRQPKVFNNTITISPYSGEADISPLKMKGTSQVNWSNLTIDVSQSNMLRSGVCLSLSGSGFLSVYQLGALDCLHRYWPHLLTRASVAGASAGAILGACVVCGVESSTVREYFLDAAASSHQLTLGPFNPRYSVEDQLKLGLDLLPSDAHVRASDRLFVSITSVSQRRNVMVSKWESREELIRCLLCSCFIPAFSGFRLPTFKGQKCVDGGFSNNLPIVCHPAITISPFNGRGVDICPTDGSNTPLYITVANEQLAVTLGNLVRCIRALLPPHVDALQNMYLMGYTDAYNFLKTSAAKKKKLLQA
ncbi:hypothetical protein Pmani_023355 [Petrolisthes manimaculis]|uniref:PNPLA domain-containing protein n=1 Tax=Petrolisthes manimaculis TaxID=1843537 RepID=A0AAE1PB86_9EUCA|nr:hypothetical protein Pmani_023355 [Petrolisthes manimaculis]